MREGSGVRQAPKTCPIEQCKLAVAQNAQRILCRLDEMRGYIRAGSLFLSLWRVLGECWVWVGVIRSMGKLREPRLREGCSVLETEQRKGWAVKRARSSARPRAAAG